MQAPWLRGQGPIAGNIVLQPCYFLAALAASEVSLRMLLYCFNCFVETSRSVAVKSEVHKVQLGPFTSPTIFAPAGDFLLRIQSATKLWMLGTLNLGGFASGSSL